MTEPSYRQLLFERDSLLSDYRALRQELIDCRLENDSLRTENKRLSEYVDWVHDVGRMEGPA